MVSSVKSSVVLILVLSHDEKLGVSERGSGPLAVAGDGPGGLDLHRRPRLLVLLDGGELAGVIGADEAVVDAADTAAHTAGHAVLAVLEARLLGGQGGVHDVLGQAFSLRTG